MPLVLQIEQLRPFRCHDGAAFFTQQYFLMFYPLQIHSHCQA